MFVKNLIIGAGLTGAVLAERLASQLNEEVLIIERRNHIGGNCYDYRSDCNITIQKYGPHIIHTNDKEVWDYLSLFTDWHYFILKTKVFIDNTLTSIPFNLNSIRDLFPRSMAADMESKLIQNYGYGKKVSILEMMKTNDSTLQYLAEYIYEKMFKNYTYKQWGHYPEEIDPYILSRVPVSISKNDGYFDDKYQGIPLHGYTSMIKNMISHPKVTVILNSDFADMKDISYDRLFYTGSIDEYFSYKYGVLPYRSLRFDIKKKNIEYYQNVTTVRYPNNYDFTRIYEHKYFLNEKSDSTYISIEYPEEFCLSKNERFYPVANAETAALYDKYKLESLNLKNTFFCGRLGEYKYINMDVIVKKALALFSNIKKQEK